MWLICYFLKQFSTLNNSKNYCNKGNNQQHVYKASRAISKESDSSGYNED